MRGFEFSASASLLTVAAMAVLPTAAQAQDAQAETAASETENNSGEIIVTAQRRAESLNDVPVSVQAFSGEQLANSGVVDAAGLSQVTSGLNFTRSETGTPIFTLRGIGFNTPNLSSTSPVGFYVDEVAYPFPHMASGPIFDLERVEVLKGPQGTLYGRNTTGGLVNFIVKKPGDSFEGYAQAEIGNFQTYNLEGGVTVPLGTNAGVRLSGRWENSDKGWQRSVSRPGDRLGEVNRLGLRAVFDARPTDRLSVQLTGSYWYDKSDTVATQAVALTPDAPAFTAPGLAAAIRTNWKTGQADWDPFDGSKPAFVHDSRFFGVAGRLSYELTDDLSLVSLTAYNDLRRNNTNDLDGTPLEAFSYQSVGRIKSFSQELRLAGGGDGFNYTVGGYYSNDRVDDDLIGYFDRASTLARLRFVSQSLDRTNVRFTPAEYAGGFRTFRTTTEQRSESKSVFASGDVDLSEHFNVAAGLRYADDSLKSNACSRDRNGNTRIIWNTALPAVIFQRTGIFTPVDIASNGCLTYNSTFTGQASFERPTLNENNLSGRIALNYKINRDSLIYASVSRGYKSGAVPVLAANVETQWEPATQEKVTAYELGSKLGFGNGAAQINGALFYLDYRDKQLFGEILDPVFTTLSRIINVPKSRVYGFELEGVLRPVRSLTFNANLAYTNTRVQQYVGFDRLGQVKDFAGATFPYTPTWQINAGATYDGPISPSLDLVANMNINHQSKTSSALEANNDFVVAGYEVVNASIKLQQAEKGWSIGVWARNLFNANYYTGTDTSTDTVHRNPGRSRTFGATFGWRF